jgi:hypothetical protein
VLNRRHVHNGGPVVPGGGIFSWTLSLITWPIRWPVTFAFRALAGIFQFVANLVGFGAPNHNRRVQFWPPSSPVDPQGDVRRFVEHFSATYDTRRLPFYCGSYSQVPALSISVVGSFRGKNFGIEFWTNFLLRRSQAILVFSLQCKFLLNIKPNLSLVLKVRPNLIQRINSQVLEKAKQDLQFLLVYLHSPSHADTGRFCRTTLSSPELVRRSRFL